MEDLVGNKCLFLLKVLKDESAFYANECSWIASPVDVDANMCQVDT